MRPRWKFDSVVMRGKGGEESDGWWRGLEVGREAVLLLLGGREWIGLRSYDKTRWDFARTNVLSDLI